MACNLARPCQTIEEERERTVSITKIPPIQFQRRTPAGRRAKCTWMMGSAFGLEVPLWKTFSETLYYEVDLPEPGRLVTLPAAPEAAIYVVRRRSRCGCQRSGDFCPVRSSDGDQF